MSYTIVETFDAGQSRTGLSTVAYSLDGGQSWNTNGVAELSGVPGVYRAAITFADNFSGTLSWTTGDSSPRRASTPINPVRLGPNGLDAISVADPGGIVNMNSLPKLIVATWRKLFKKTDMTSNEERTYADNNTTVNTIQPLSDNGSVQTRGAAT